MIYDEQQQRVIEISRGEHLVLAPPGCGKTAILAERVRRAVQRGVSPGDMLCLTFTNRAARGMEGRITAMAGNEVAEELFVGNIHRFCANYLFGNGLLPQSGNILDEKDSFSIFEELIPEADAGNRDYFRNDHLAAVMKFEHLMHQFRHGHPSDLFVSVPELPTVALHALCDAAGVRPTRSGLVQLMDGIDTIGERVKDVRPHATAIHWLKMAAGYRAYKLRNNLIDFDDILLRAYDALRADSNRKRYRWMQIDEVQDLNPLQMAVADLLKADMPDSVALYLGDEQQAIFSFIGARLTMLDKLRERCGDNCHSLSRNYRSPRYLLDLYNEYAIENLGADSDRLPSADNQQSAPHGHLRLLSSENNLAAPSYIAKVAESYTAGGETCAVIVSRNSEADEISEKLGDTPHFKISGTDFFATPGMQLILSHLNILSMEFNFLAWTRLLYSMGLVKSLAQGRKTMRRLMDAAITPTDFFRNDGKTYLCAFDDATDGPIVIYDTETTGLDITGDDIVQIAAMKIVGGKVVDTLNIMLHTDKAIPPMLGDLENPLVKEYAATPHLSRRQGLQRFMEFAEGSTLVGHNVEFDYNILDYNLRRDCPETDLRSRHPERFDTLKLARLIYPDLRSHKLKDLLAQLSLEGENSHLANDDIEATHSLMKHLLQRAAEPEFALEHRKTWERAVDKFGAKVRERYGDIYLSAKQRLYDSAGRTALVDEIDRLYNLLKAEEQYQSLTSKIDYVKEFVQTKVDSLPVVPAILAEQLGRLVMELNTYREADLCEAGIIREPLFIATVHKAKGLEFDNVIIYGAVDGAYPSFLSKTDADKLEDARKLYVALTRARKRLVIHTYRNFIGTSRHGTQFSIAKEVSPYLLPVMRFFDRK
ncbi:MAG: UvrD-helicase domain-containing protein [Muribaculaceae bacterium]|nr:UvrD-helicase domain-containing protein [Muribaculaceae bacterium]